MRLENFHGRKPGETGHVPLRTTKEISEEFGVSPQRLGQLLKADTTAPKPKLNTLGGTIKNYWYDPREVRAWWASRKACE